MRKKDHYLWLHGTQRRNKGFQTSVALNKYISLFHALRRNRYFPDTQIFCHKREEQMLYDFFQTLIVYIQGEIFAAVHLL